MKISLYIWGPLPPPPPFPPPPPSPLPHGISCRSITIWNFILSIIFPTEASFDRNCTYFSVNLTRWSDNYDGFQDPFAVSRVFRRAARINQVCNFTPVKGSRKRRALVCGWNRVLSRVLLVLDRRKRVLRSSLNLHRGYGAPATFLELPNKSWQFLDGLLTDIVGPVRFPNSIENSSSFEKFNFFTLNDTRLRHDPSFIFFRNTRDIVITCESWW